MSEERCENCRLWVAIPESKPPRGECRAKAPLPSPNSTVVFNGISYPLPMRSPATEPWYFCGQFCRKDEVMND